MFGVGRSAMRRRMIKIRSNAIQGLQRQSGYDINFGCDVFAPIARAREGERQPMTGTAIADAKLAFLKKFKTRL